MTLNQLITHELSHIIMYVICIIPVYLYRKQLINFITFFAGLIATLIIDIDHLLDYYFYSKSFRAPMSIQGVFKGEYFELSNKAYLFFHTWELVILLVLLYISKKSDKYAPVLLFIIIGLIAHLTFDTLSYGFNWDVYFLINRFLNNYSDVLFIRL